MLRRSLSRFVILLALLTAPRSFTQRRSTLPLGALVTILVRAPSTFEPATSSNGTGLRAITAVRLELPATPTAFGIRESIINGSTFTHTFNTTGSFRLLLPSPRRDDDRHGQRHPRNSNANADTHPDPHAESNPNSNSNHTNSYADPKPNPNADTNPEPDANPSPTPTPAPFSQHPLLFPPTTTASDIPVNIDEACVQILDGPCTYMWTYGGTYPGLSIRRPTGQTTRVTFTNNLDPIAGGLTVHNHGNHTSPIDDGYVTGPGILFGPGTSRTYTYDGTENGGNERGTMQFYHDHRMGETGLNVWMGLQGLYIIDDPADPSTLPSGTYELPLTIADRQFDQDNQLQYIYDASGVVGDKVLINGVYQPYHDVADRKYRLRFLNGANARIYILTLSTGDAFTQIGTESGLLPAPVSRTAMEFGPAERLDVVVDFSGKLGQEIYLMDMYKVTPLLKFRVTQHVADGSSVPATLRPLPDIGTPTVTRNYSFDFTSNHWTINGMGFDPKRIDARPVLGTTEKWIFTNPTGTTHMVHIHDVDQQCLTRDGGPCYPWETMKETWALGSGETIELKLRFTDHIGLYMMHCHILEHEDDGMMGQFEVVAPATPTPTPAPTPGTVTISGTISYCNNPNPAPVPNATLLLTGDAQNSTITSGAGAYSFSALPSGYDYAVTPAKAPLGPGGGNINTVDVIAVQRHFLIIGPPLVGCRLTAADVTGDSAINTSDVIAIQRFVLAQPTGLANVGKYQFSPTSRTYPGVQGDQANQNYDALIFGDVAFPYAQ